MVCHLSSFFIWRFGGASLQYIYINIEANFNNLPIDRNTDNRWLLEKATLTFVDLRVSTNFGVSSRKLGLEFLLPTSIYKMCDLH